MKGARKLPPFGLRMPEYVKEAITRKAEEEGLSLNSAIVQRLVRSLKNDDKQNAVAQ